MSPSDDIAPNIEELIRKVSLGNRAAFQLLYVRTSAKLFGVCLRILNDRSEAEDVLQEVFVKIWRRASSFDAGKSRGITWLAAVARNQSIDRLRTRRQFDENVDDAYDLEDDMPGPEALTVSDDEYRTIYDCLAKLDERHSRAIKRTYLDGWTYQQAADELEVPLNTVKTWIRRSLGTLRECMKR